MRTRLTVGGTVVRGRTTNAALVPTDADAAFTVTVTSLASGTTVASGQAVPNGDGDGRFTVTLDAATTGSDELTVTGTATVGGVARDVRLVVDVVGSPYVTVDAVAQRLSDTSSALPDEDVVLRHAQVVEDRIDRYLGWSWRDTIHVENANDTYDGYQVIRLSRTPVNELVRVTRNGTVQSTVGWEVSERGIVHPTSPVLLSDRMTVVYRAGQPGEAPSDVVWAATEAALYAVRRDSDRHAQRDAEFDGGFPFQNADVSRDRPFGLDGVDATINARLNRTALA